MNQLFPPIEAFETGYLKVSPIHELYYEICGNPEGKPILFLHGGPGAGIDENCRRFFDPDFYKIILFDQRGCGKSKPYGELTGNTSWELVKDIEKLRKHLNIENWIVFGGSWGVTLALLYAIYERDCVNALILRGVWLSTEEEIDWYLRGGAAKIFPEAWENFVKPLPKNISPSDIISTYYELFNHGNESILNEAAKAWSGWEARISKLHQSEDLVSEFEDLHKAVAIAKIECHYFINNYFGKKDSYIFDNIDTISDIPTFIVNGRYDMVCPIRTAYRLAKQMKNCEFVVAANSGHSSSEDEIIDQLIDATERYKKYAK